MEFRRRHVMAPLVVAVALLTAGCAATEEAITAVRADELPGAGSASPPFQPTEPSADDPVDVTDQPPVTDAEPGATSSSPEPAPTGSEPSSTDAPGGTAAPSVEVDPTAIDFGTNKPPQERDDFLLATISDLDVWWAQEFPAVYGGEFTPIGAVYAAYPARPDDIPGCGTPRTTYREVNEFAAFYCGVGDFMVYDDGPDGLLHELSAQFGPSAVAIVLAHEYGHAIQQRAGLLDRGLATIVSEQQADCFAGAWAARAAAGSVAGIVFTTDDVKAGLISMLEVSDPLGVDQYSPGGHGSGFDRVGAFQEGFSRGAARCAELVDEPLDLVPNQFVDTDDRLQDGNAPWGYDGSALLGFVPVDLNLYWGTDLADVIPGFDDLALVPVTSADDVSCASLSDGLEDGAALCPDDDTVYLNEPAALALYQEQTFGDFSVGYLIAVEWAEAAQLALGSDLTGEDRALANDCLAGAWVHSVIPTEAGFPEPRSEERTMTVSPGDLDEAVHTAIHISDETPSDDLLGDAFEKIEAFRIGVLGGLDPCLARL